MIKGLYPETLKKYCIQLERGDSGYMHLQGRISLIKKRTDAQAATHLRELGLQDFKLLYTSGEVAKNDKHAFYCMKTDTRVEGPWKDDDPKPKYIPRQIRDIVELYGWQKTVIEISKIWDTRHVNMIIDKVGNKGKSTLVQYMRCNDLACKIPFANDYKDIMRMAFCMGEAKCYIIDLPRAINKEKLYQLYSAIEELKGGFCFDDRQVFRFRDFDCPNIWVFSNCIPDPGLLSSDRWKYWQIIDNELISCGVSKLPSGELGTY